MVRGDEPVHASQPAAPLVAPSQDAVYVEHRVVAQEGEQALAAQSEQVENVLER